MAKKSAAASASKVSDLFEKGLYQDVLALTVDSESGSFAQGARAHVVTAMAFTGRVDDALAIFSRAQALSANDVSLARFGLALGLVRVSRYGEAVAFLVDNLRASRRPKATDAEKFYAAQGAAAYRFFQCRYQRALDWAKRAWTAALVGELKHGQMLAADMRGHAMVRVGDITKGLKALRDAERLARTLGNAGHAGAVQAAVSAYELAYGLAAENAVLNLKAEIRTIDAQDNWTLASAEIELARQLSLQGDLDGSDRLLAHAAKIILVAGHGRQKALLRHSLAFNRYLAGRHAEALDFLREAESSINPSFDAHHHLVILGLRLRILETPGHGVADASSLVPDLRERVRVLTARTGDGIARNILWRDEGLGSPTVTGDDPLGDLRHLCRTGAATPFADVAKIIDAGLLGFLRYVMPFPVGARVVCLDLVPGSLFLFDAGNVIRSRDRISGIMKSVLLALSKGPKAKRELVEQIWGYDYHSFRHDPVLYAVINRLRGALDSRAAWIQATAGDYFLESGVRVFVHEHATEAPLAALRSGAAELSSPLEAEADAAVAPDLNHRQLVILSELGRTQFLSATACAEMFNVSRVTATRDLTELRQRKLLVRVGKGRATVYRVSRRRPEA